MKLTISKPISKGRLDPLLNEFLNENENHVRAEAIRYGVDLLKVRPEISYSWLEMIVGGVAAGVEVTYAGDVADNESTRGLAIGSQVLLDRKRKRDRVKVDYENYLGGQSAAGYGELLRQLRYAGINWESQAIEKRELMFSTKKDLDITRVQVETKFPILADFRQRRGFQMERIGGLGQRIQRKEL